MSFCEEKLIKLNERMDQPLPSYTREQINRTSKIQVEANLRQAEEQNSDGSGKNAKMANNIGETERGQNLEQGPLTDKKINVRKTANKNTQVVVKKSALKEKLNEKDEDEVRNSNFDDKYVSIRRSGSDLFSYLFHKRNSIKITSNNMDNNSSKRLKESEGSNSKFDSPLINANNVQKNKITDYFNFGQNNPLSLPSEPAIDNIAKFKIDGKRDSYDSTMNKIGGSTTGNEVFDNHKTESYRQLIKDRDRELVKLHKALQTKDSELNTYKTKVKQQVSTFLLELEQLKRAEKRSYIKTQKLRIGEFVTHRVGAKFIETWIDGHELRELKSKLEIISKDKDNIEKLRRSLQKKKSKLNGTEDKVGAPDTSDYSNCNVLDINQYRMFLSQIPQNPSEEELMTLPSNKAAISDIKERLNYQLQFLTKEESSIKERIAALELEKNDYLKAAEALYEEENSRFGRLDQQDNSLRWPFLAERYQILSLLGKGGFSEVYRAYDCLDMKFVACKIHQLSPNWSETVKSNYIRHALRENQVLKALNHPNIIRHYDSVEIDSNSFCTVLEYCSGPDLATYLKAQKTLTEREAKLIIRQILSALRFLNENDKKVIHYDLKPQNIMFHKGVIKISDFGLCKVMNEGETKVELTSQGVGTYWYLPPECFNPQYPQISTKVDVWSVGVIFYEILYGCKPFGNNMSQERILKEGIILNLKEVEFPVRPAVSSETKDFIEKCLEYFQENRLDVMEAWELINKL